ncbi:hypothetical protein P1J78_14170 [Psychromarinibacter sp. C21-152]|uniref:Cytochrome c domain-containing protein n=1 Tax=Psychromarinibacter sediminicola TaxID=3033385 RepID=A0AAE3NQX5_9RHOB|nr:hypothetical protein [Psychromarinibacter sediminicola]MDF0601888.1 hypothetical protein [Psychromarinibacter sediminicola]
MRRFLLAPFLALALAAPAAALPQYANDTGAQCSFCHAGPPANRKFTRQGVEYYNYLKGQNAGGGGSECAQAKAQCSGGNDAACVAYIACELAKELAK